MTAGMTQRDEYWRRHGIFYQIYPRSFQDFNADGVGDIAGIIDRLPYLLELGVDAIRLSPIFPSPMAISVTTSPITSASIRRSARWRISTR